MISNQEERGGAFSAPFRRPQSFMRNVLARVSNSTAAESISAPHTAPALIEQSQSSPLETVTPSDLRPTIKQVQDSSPHKPYQTKEDLFASNQPNPGPTASVPTAASPKEKNLVAGSTPNASKNLFSVIETNPILSYTSVQQPSATSRTDSAPQTNNQRSTNSLQIFISTVAVADLAESVETMERKFEETPRDITILNSNSSLQQLSIRKLEAGQQKAESTLTSISATLDRLFDRIDNLPRAPPQVPPQAPPQAPLQASLQAPPPNTENANNATSDLLSFDDSTDNNIPPPPVNHITCGDDCDSAPHTHDNDPTDNVIPTASPVQGNQILGMMPIQYVRLSDLNGVLNTRNTDLVFPTFHPSSDIFHSALRKINNHHRLGGYVIANTDDTLTLDKFMPLPEQAILVDSLKDALPNWFWDLHVPDTWELRNKGVDIWEQLTLEHGIIASSTAEKEQILTEWEHFVGPICPKMLPS